MFLALMLSALVADPAVVKAPPQVAASTVQISLNHDGYYAMGDGVTARIKSSEDGYLVVFRATTRGHVRVLYPIDPGVDNFVRGGKTYEVVGRGGKESFRVDDEEGSGVLYAAVSEDPLQFDQFVRGDHWDYRAFENYQVSDDAEAVFGDLMEKMVAGGRYQFDLVSYHVAGQSDYSVDGGHYHDYSGWYAPCFGCGGYYGGGYYGGGYYGSGFSISVGFGVPFYPYYYPFYPYYSGFYNPFYTPFYGYNYYRPVYGSPYYANCYYGSCGGYNSGPYYGGRPPYTFKPGTGGTPVGYRPRLGGTNPGPGIGVSPRDPRNPVDGPRRPAPRRDGGRPVSNHDDAIGIGNVPRRRVGVEDLSIRPSRPQYAPNPGNGTGSSAVPRRQIGVGDRSGRPDVSSQDGSRAQPRAPYPSSQPSQGQAAPRRAQAPSSGGGSSPSYHPQPRGQSGGGGGGGGMARPSGGGSARRPT